MEDSCNVAARATIAILKLGTQRSRKATRVDSLPQMAQVVYHCPSGPGQGLRGGRRGRRLRSGRASGGCRRGGGRVRGGTQLELHEHHVVPEPHRQVQRRSTTQEIVHLRVAEGFERLHDALFGSHRLETGFHAWQQCKPLSVTHVVRVERTVFQLPVAVQQNYPVLGEPQSSGKRAFEGRYAALGLQLELHASARGGVHADRDAAALR